MLVTNEWTFSCVSFSDSIFFFLDVIKLLMQNNNFSVSVVGFNAQNSLYIYLAYLINLLIT